MKRMALVSMTVLVLFVSLGCCAVDQRYVNHDGACQAMPCRWKPGAVNE